MITLLLKNWQLIAIGLLLAALAGSGVYVNLLKSQQEVLEQSVANLTAALSISEESNKGLRLSIHEQNAAVEKLKEAADQREKAAQAELRRARAATASAKLRASELLKQTVPQGQTECDAANSLFNEEIRRAKK